MTEETTHFAAAAAAADVPPGHTGGEFAEFADSDSLSLSWQNEAILVLRLLFVLPACMFAMYF